MDLPKGRRSNAEYTTLVCEVLDVVQKVTIDGETPTTKQFVAYNPTDDTTTYQDVDPAQDLDVNSLPTLATLANTDALIINDSNSGTNKKIAPNQIKPTITAQAPLTIYNNGIGLSYDKNDSDNIGSGLALKNTSISVCRFRMSRKMPGPVMPPGPSASVSPRPWRRPTTSDARTWRALAPRQASRPAAAKSRSWRASGQPSASALPAARQWQLASKRRAGGKHGYYNVVYPVALALRLLVQHLRQDKYRDACHHHQGNAQHQFRIVPWGELRRPAGTPVSPRPRRAKNPANGPTAAPWRLMLSNLKALAADLDVCLGWGFDLHGCGFSAWWLWQTAPGALFGYNATVPAGRSWLGAHTPALTYYGEERKLRLGRQGGRGADCGQTEL